LYAFLISKIRATFHARLFVLDMKITNREFRHHTIFSSLLLLPSS
jgi:hypothetical protein